MSFYFIYIFLNIYIIDKIMLGYVVKIFLVFEAILLEVNDNSKQIANSNSRIYEKQNT